MSPVNWLSSFDFDALRLARAAMDSVPLAVIAEELSDAVIALAHEITAHSLNLWWETLRRPPSRRWTRDFRSMSGP